MNEEILNNIWSHLTEKGLTQSDFDTWKTNVSGSSDVQANIHSYLIDSELTSSDFDTWANNAGLKKKKKRNWFQILKRKLRNLRSRS